MSLFDKWYQVFVSSTYEDLIEERQEVMHALLELDCIPSGMELFPAANEDQWTLIKRVIDVCDYYVVIIGGRYGSVDESGISYTEKEYRYALVKNKPIITFLHKNPSELPANKTDMNEEKFNKLMEFRDYVSNKMVKFWSDAKDLGSVVSRSLIKLIKQHPAIGWVRADLLPDKDPSSEILKLKQQIEELNEQLEKERSSPPKGTEKYVGGESHFLLKYSFIEYRDFRDTQSWEAKTYTSWNEAFSIISPSMIDECNEYDIKARINDYLYDKEHERHDNSRKFKIDRESFDSLIVQFNALEMIRKSAKKHTASDTNVYWSLTEFGKQLMLKLRAKKNPDYFEGDIPESEKAVMIKLQNGIEDWIVQRPELGYFKNLYVGKKNVIQLSLYESDLFELPSTIDNLDHLEVLRVIKCELLEIPPELFNINSLQNIDFSMNSIKEIPSEIKNLFKLKKLDLSNNKIKKIPESIGELKELESLYLNNNGIEFIPKTILNLKKLRSLSLTFGEISEFPSSIIKLNKLESLVITGGNFETLPDLFYELKNLKYLYIRCDKLTKISHLLGNFVDLIELEIGGENLGEFPSEIGDLSKLNSLTLSDSKIFNIPDSLSKLEKLETLFIAKKLYDSLKAESKQLLEILESKGLDLIIDQ